MRCGMWHLGIGGKVAGTDPELDAAYLHQSLAHTRLDDARASFDER